MNACTYRPIRTRPVNKNCFYRKSMHCLYGEVIMHYFAHTLQWLIYIRCTEYMHQGDLYCVCRFRHLNMSQI
jgi:hypothetical protein